MDYEDLALIEANELSEDQFETFLDEVEMLPTARSPVSGNGARLLFAFMEDTGLRVTEALHVRKKDLDWQTRMLTVMHPKSERQCPCSEWRYKDLRTRSRILISADRNCDKCHGKGKWKKPQRTTFTPRIHAELYQYVTALKDDDVLWPISRMTVWRWGKTAGKKAGINIFQQKDTRKIEGIFPHLFRALCSKRMVKLAHDHPYKDALIACKMRHAYRIVTDRYTQITINYLVSWERKVYSEISQR